MKILKNLVLVIIFVTYLFSTISVNALQIMSEENKKNLEILQEQGSSELINLYNDQSFVMGPEWFDEAGNLGEMEILNVKYVETSTYISSEGPEYDVRLERNLTEQEYNNWKPIQTKTVCSGNSSLDCWETNAKRILIIYQTYPTEQLMLINQWKTMPSVRSFDTIGMTLENFTMTSATGRQWFNYKSSPSISRSVDYSYKGKNMKISTTDTKGISITQNILDDAYSLLQNDLYVVGKGYQDMRITGSYQHAVKYIEFETSKNFTFDVWGMGHVFKWNAPTSNWDNMQGVCVNWSSSSNLWVC